MTIFDRIPHARPMFATAGAAVAVVALATACSSGTSSGSGGSSSSAVSAPTSSAGSAATTGSGEPISAASSSLGTIVVNGKGFTVYDFAPDTPTTSACSGTCATFWPPVPAPAAVPASLPGITGALTALTRADGSKQLVLNGHPLYTFAGDKAAGQANGQAQNIDGGLWLVLTPAGAEVSGTASTAPTGAPSTPASSSASSSKASGGGYGY